MSRTFRDGEKVMCVKEYTPHLIYGKIYTVLDGNISNVGTIIIKETSTLWWNYERFKSVDKEHTVNEILKAIDKL